MKHVLQTAGALWATIVFACCSNAKPPDACTLLAGSEIEKVQGEPLKAAKGSLTKDGSVLVSQCFFSLPTASNSISLALTLPGQASAPAGRPRELWKQRFHKGGKGDTGGTGSSEEEEEEQGAHLVPVSGLGDEAFWVHRFVGTLYVLKGDAFLRISLGGKQDDSARLRKAQILAGYALPRMP